MHLFQGSDQIVPDKQAALTIGNFDGVHLGHQALMREVVSAARRLAGQATVVTFDPHPQALLHPDRKPALLTTLDEKTRLLDKLGIDRLVVLPFGRELADTPARRFISEGLVERIGVCELFVGVNFRFGKDKEGDFDLLKSLAPALGYEVHAIESVLSRDQMISSTSIRRLLAKGEVTEANNLLGHPYEIGGRIVSGDGRGATLGFPTANVDPSKECLLPHGVYAVDAELPDSGERNRGALNYGLRPTFAGTAPSIEVHLLDFPARSLEGCSIRVEFQRLIRQERRFASAKELKAQIAQDIAACRLV